MRYAGWSIGIRVCSQARVKERVAVAAEEEAEKAEKARQAKEARKAKKEAEAAAKAKADQSFQQRVDRRRSSTQLVGGPTSALQEIAKKAEEERAEREKKLRKSFAVFDADGDGYLTVNEVCAPILTSVRCLALASHATPHLPRPLPQAQPSTISPSS